MEIALRVAEIILIALGGLTLIALIVDKGKKHPINTLYFKQYPDGTRAFRLGLKVDIDKLEPGDKFEVIVQSEPLTETDIMIYKNVKEE